MSAEESRATSCGHTLSPTVVLAGYLARSRPRLAKILRRVSAFSAGVAAIRSRLLVATGSSFSHPLSLSLALATPT
jgi:hypothetical protein